MTPPRPSDSALLAESAWLHRLARRLLSRDEADDLAQEALLAAWQQPPQTRVPLRAWLVGIVRNLAHAHRRSELRRQSHEANVRPRPPQDDSAHMLLRLELQQQLLAAVRQLDEPYRTTVSLRFLDQLSVEEIASRMQAPSKTVRTRIDRALVRLRQRLDRDFGNRGAWIAATVQLVHASPPTPTAAIPATTPLLTTAIAPLFVMGTLAKWSVPAAALAVLGFFAVRSMAGPSPDLEANDNARSPAQLAASANLPAPLRVDAGSQDQTTRALVANALEDGSNSTAPKEPATLRGFVRDALQRPIFGIEVRYAPDDTKPATEFAPPNPGAAGPEEPERAVAITDAVGAFALPLANGTYRLVARGLGLETLRAPTVRGVQPPEPLIVYVGAACDFAGRVTDASGAPIQEAELQVQLDPELALQLTSSSLSGAIPVARVTTDAEGRFTFPALGHSQGHRVFVAAAGFHSERRPLPDGSDRDLTFTLVRRGAEAGVYEGRVEYADGTPAAGAFVSSGDAAVRCDEHGRFALTPEPESKPTHVRAAVQGYLPAQLELENAPPSTLRDLVLVLGSKGLEITGVVRNAEGTPIADARVWTQDGDRFGSVVHRVGAVSMQLPFDVEGMIDGTDDGQKDGRECRTGTDGSFALRSLGNRSYRVFALRRGTLELAGPIAVAAGSRDVQITLPGLEPAARIAGHVTTLDGRPLAHAQVRLERTLAMAGGSPLVVRDDAPTAVKTDDDGAFAFDSVCTDGTRLVAELSEGGGSTSLDLASATDKEQIVLAVSQRCFLRVELRDPTSAETIFVHDAKGTALQLEFEIGGVRLQAPGLPIADGKSERIATDERAATLVLWKGRQEVGRVPLRLRAGEVETVRW
jgi:RNA polymerase sigma-70 factor (ECF subfamily)